VAGDGDALEPELVERRQEIAFVVGVAVGVAVPAEAVPAQVECGDTDAGEERRDA
jgi:hypothetical protein